MVVENLKLLEELKEIVNELKKQGKKIVFTNGCYDLIHRGHIDVLRKASELGNVFIVGLNSDSSVKRFKGETRPINNEIDRAYVVGNVKGVDYVIIFEEDTPLILLKELKPDVLVKGGNPLPERVAEEKKLVEEYGGIVILLGLVEGYSSSNIIEKMKK